MTENFQDGCDTIVAGCTTYGATPTSNSPTDIVNAIKKIYTDRYNSGLGDKKYTVVRLASGSPGYSGYVMVTYTFEESYELAFTINNCQRNTNITGGTIIENFSLSAGNGQPFFICFFKPSIGCIVKDASFVYGFI